MKNKARGHRKSGVLVGVLKNGRDLRLLLRERWYRIPLSFMPKRQFTHVAFYQPAVFGKNGKCIRYYARVLKKERVKRIDLLPKETRHPRAHDEYVKITFRQINKLPRSIKNIIPRRVSFGFTGLRALLSAKDMLELYGVPKTEQVVARRLKPLGIEITPEHTVSREGRRYRIDIAIFCKNGRIAVECDNKKAHSGKIQTAKDRAKDAFLKRHGWHVIRLTEKEIVENLDRCAEKVGKVVQNLGGQTC